MQSTSLRFAALALVSLGGCVAPPELDSAPDFHGVEDPAGDVGRATGDLALSGLGAGCSTAGTEGLSAQLLDEMQCLSDGALVRYDDPNIVLTSTRVHPYLSPAGRDAILHVAATHPIQINSGLRTIAEQYVLSRGCAVAAPPGRSNHETGRAIDVANYTSVGRYLIAAGFAHPLPSSDPVHYEASGDDLRPISVKAFQTLWNANHPEDRLAVDGSAGSATLTRLARSPAGGFPISGVCSHGGPPPPPPPTADAGPPPPPPPVDAGPPPPVDAGPPPPVDAGTHPTMTCTHSLGGIYAAGGCSASYQCCSGHWSLRTSGCGTCTCLESTGRIGCGS